MPSTDSPVLIPVHTLDGISVVDSNLNHVVSLASLSDSKLTNAQQTVLENILTFPGFTKAFQYYFQYNNSEGISSSLFGPVVVQLHPADMAASLLYLERSIGESFLYTILIKEYRLEKGIPRFPDENLDCIHFASKDRVLSHFNRVQPAICIVSTLISLANSIYTINHSDDAGVMNFLEYKSREIAAFRNQPNSNPIGLLLAPYGKTSDGNVFSLEEDDSDESLSSAWHEDFVDAIVNFRMYTPPLLEYIIKNKREVSNHYVNESIGPIRLKFIHEKQAIGLFVRVRSHSSQGFEFWTGLVPFEGNRTCPHIDYNQIAVQKKGLTSIDMRKIFPSINSLDFLLPLYLHVFSFFYSNRGSQKSIHEIIAECKKNHPRETRNALAGLAKIKGCRVDELLETCSEEEIQMVLHNAIHLVRESHRLMKEMRPYRFLGSSEDILFPGSQEEFESIRKERVRAVRDAEYQRRMVTINRRTPLPRKS